MSKRAVVLAGGKGSRLHPYTIVLPKPLMPIGEFPILEVIVRQLTRDGFTHITMAVNHQAEIIQAFFGNGDKWGVKIDYSLEDRALSTMAPLKLIDDLPENFLVMNGDILSDFHFAHFYDYHIRNTNLFTIASYRRDIKSEFGVLTTNGKGQLTDFKEKPTSSYDVSMGIYMLDRNVLELIPDSVTFGFDDLMYKLISEKRFADTFLFDGIWLDIGRPDDYISAIDLFEEKRHVFLPQ
jgi:NDP-mannose synthase